MSTCNICGARLGFHPKFTKFGNVFSKCESCRTLAQEHAGGFDANKFYDQGYYEAWGLTENKAQVEQAKSATFSHLLRKNLPAEFLHTDRKLLDIGCASGVLLSVAKDLGFRCWGVELSKYSSDIAKTKFGENIFCGMLADAKYPDEFFDVITMTDLIEHVSDPAALLKEVNRILKPGGVVVTSTPDTNTFSAKLLGKHWHNYLPEHLYYFDKTSFRSLFANNGLIAIGRKRVFVKFLSLSYILHWFLKNPMPLVTPLAKVLFKLIPRGVQQMTLPFFLGDMVITTKKKTTIREKEYKKVSIIVPAYNEAKTIVQCLENVTSANVGGLEKEVIVVESNSSDNTRELLRREQDRLGYRVILQAKPQGKGSAVREGLANATGDIVIIQDADTEYSVKDYPALLEPIALGKTLFTLGSRVAGSKKWAIRRFSSNFLVSVVFNVGGLGVNFIFNRIYKTRLSDQATMYKVFDTRLVEPLKFESNSWDLDVEILAKAVRMGIQPVELPVHYESRDINDGKKMRFKDVFTVLGAMWKYRAFRVA